MTQDLLGRDRYTGEGQAVAHDLIGRPGLRGEHQPMGCLNIWKIWKSVGIIIPNIYNIIYIYIWKNRKCSKPPTRDKMGVTPEVGMWVSPPCSRTHQQCSPCNDWTPTNLDDPLLHGTCPAPNNVQKKLALGSKAFVGWCFTMLEYFWVRKT